MINPWLPSITKTDFCLLKNLLTYSPRGLSAVFIHDQVGSFADPFSTSQIETGDGCEASSRSSGAALAGDHNLVSQEYLESSIEFARQADDRATERKANFYLGIVYSSRGDHRQAIEFYKKSLDMAEKAGALPEVKRAKQYLGNSYLVLAKAHLVWLVFVQFVISFLLLL